jgi:hypothetical protein
MLNFAARFIVQAKIIKTLRLEEKNAIGSQTRLFSSNLRGDTLIFVGINSDIKILDSETGKFVGDIDGAHFKGTYNFGLVVSVALSNKLRDLQAAYDDDPTEDRKVDNFIEQLNHCLLISVSVKDKLKLWKFEDGLSSPVAQGNAIGGTLDSSMTVLNTADKHLCLLIMGNASNKVELFQIK